MAIDVLALDGRILASSDGSGVMITDVKIRENINFEGELKAQLVIGGRATAYLNNPRDASEGTVELSEEVNCEEMVDLEKADKQLFFDKVNRTFGISPPLVDNEESLLRLVEGGDAHSKIVGQKVYFKLSKGRETKAGLGFWTNMTTLPSVQSATKDSLQAVLARLREKQAAKNKGSADTDKALAEMLG
jgi:hypothetical protein